MSDHAILIVQQTVSDHMNEIVSLFKPGAKITVIVRSPGLPEADFMMTSDDPAEAVALINRRVSAANDSAGRATDPTGDAGLK